MNKGLQSQSGHTNALYAASGILQAELTRPDFAHSFLLLLEKPSA